MWDNQFCAKNPNTIRRINRERCERGYAKVRAAWAKKLKRKNHKVIVPDILKESPTMQPQTELVWCTVCKHYHHTPKPNCYCTCCVIKRCSAL